MRTRLRAGVACGAGVVLGLACADDERAPPLGSPRPIAGCERFSYAPCDILGEACQRELFGLMACLRGDAEPGEPPSVRLLSAEDALALVTGESAAEVMTMTGTDGVAPRAGMAGDERTFQAQLRGFELLGLIEAGQVQTPADVAEVASASVLAYYTVATQEIVIIDRGEPLASLDANGVLAHELVHALQDRRHGFAALSAEAAPESDGSLALASLVEGDATLYQSLYSFAAQGANLERFNFAGLFASLAEYGSELTLEQGSPLLTAPSIFPYTHGARYVGERWLRGGAGALDALFADPPRTTLEVLGGSGDPAALEGDPAPLDGYTLAGTDVAGAWITAARLAPAVTAASLAEVARSWSRDRLWLYASGDDPLVVAAAWAIDWRDAAAASRFAQLVAALAPVGASVALETSGRSTRLCVAERAEELEAWQARLLAAAPPAP